MKQKLDKYLLVGLFVLVGQGLVAQRIEKSYISMPEVLNPVLPQKLRLELLEYHKVGQGDSVQNRFGNVSYLQVFDTLNNLIVVRNTQSTTFEMKLLKLEDGMPVVGAINTVCAPICQSDIAFYDTAWNKIPLQFTMPKAMQWINANKLAETPDLDKAWVGNVLAISFISLQFDSAGQQIIATNNTAEFLGEDDRKVIQPLLNKQPLVFGLKGKTWMLKP
ncbi:MAG: DUF3256 family protein [Paludibacter sp.]